MNHHLDNILFLIYLLLYSQTSLSFLIFIYNQSTARGLFLTTHPTQAFWNIKNNYMYQGENHKHKSSRLRLIEKQQYNNITLNEQCLQVACRFFSSGSHVTSLGEVKGCVVVSFPKMFEWLRSKDGWIIYQLINSENANRSATQFC